MAYYMTENFSAGVDTRRHPLAAPAGTLRDMRNLHITPGGEIEKRKAFVEGFDVTGSLSKSLMRVNAFVYVIGTGPDQFYGELTLRFIECVGATGELLDWDVFDGRLYFTTIDADVVKHWYQDALDAGTATEVPTGKGSYLRTFQAKVYSCSGPNIYFSGVGDPTEWDDTAKGAGFINASTNDAEALNLQGIEVYYGDLAFFSSRAVQIWQMDTDPENNLQKQTLRSIGVAGRATPRQYGAGDVLFLAPSGIRSLQARDSSSAASVSDVGSAIDLEIQAKITDNPEDILANTRTALEALSGRFWMMFSDEIYILSLFPGPKVSAWSRYIPSISGDQSFIPVELVDAAGYMCVRSADDKVYIYGGEDRNTYDNVTASFWTSFMTFGKPAHWKQMQGFDSALDGTWDVEVAFDPDDIKFEHIATLDKSSYVDQTIPIQGYAVAVSVQMTTKSPAKSRVANIAIHYNLSKDD